MADSVGNVKKEGSIRSRGCGSKCDGTSGGKPQACLPGLHCLLQELLEHPFLRPTQAAVAVTAAGPSSQSGSEVRLSREQLTKLLLQVTGFALPPKSVQQFVLFLCAALTDALRVHRAVYGAAVTAPA